jgi:hypothetical protein
MGTHTEATTLRVPYNLGRELPTRVAERVCCSSKSSKVATGPGLR